MTTLPQYNIEPKQVFHDATRNEAFNFAKAAKPTPLWVPGQDHTRVPNIIVVQKRQFIDDSNFYIKMRAETKANKEGIYTESHKLQITASSPHKEAFNKWRDVKFKTEVKPRQTEAVNNISPVKWRTSKDSTQISELLKPKQSVDGQGQSECMQDRYLSQTQRDQKWTSFDKNRNTFGPTQACTMRKVTELTTPKFVIKNRIYKDVVLDLRSQIEINKKSLKKMESIRSSPQQTSADFETFSPNKQISGILTLEIDSSILKPKTSSSPKVIHSQTQNSAFNLLSHRNSSFEVRDEDDDKESRKVFMQSQYNRSFCRDTSQDVQIDRIMRKSLNSGFNCVSPPKERYSSAYDVEQKLTEGEKPYAHMTNNLLQKSTLSVIREVQNSPGNFHQTQLGMFPFRSTMQSTKQNDMRSSCLNTTQNFFQNESRSGGQQQVSYWAGMRIDGPIAPHEKKEQHMTKLQTSWYSGGLFSPSSHRMK